MFILLKFLSFVALSGHDFTPPRTDFMPEAAWRLVQAARLKTGYVNLQGVIKLFPSFYESRGGNAQLSFDSSRMGTYVR
jgi:hypothetical protein